MLHALYGFHVHVYIFTHVVSYMRLAYIFNLIQTLAIVGVFSWCKCVVGRK